jgi:hypothetical protein
MLLKLKTSKYIITLENATDNDADFNETIKVMTKVLEVLKLDPEEVYDKIIDNLKKEEE